MTDERAEQARARVAEEVQVMIAREAVSLAALGVLLIMLHPGVQGWLRHQAWRLRQHGRRRQQAEDAAVAELRRDISRYEHGEAIQ